VKAELAGGGGDGVHVVVSDCQHMQVIPRRDGDQDVMRQGFALRRLVHWAKVSRV
jgi:hypothetical protein